MECVLVFLPRSLADFPGGRSGRLTGVFSPRSAASVDTFYVLATEPVDGPGGRCVGTVEGSGYSTDENYVSVRRVEDEEFVLSRVVVALKEVPLGRCHVVQYDEKSLVNSELYLTEGMVEEEANHFRELARHVRAARRRTSTTSTSSASVGSSPMILALLALLPSVAPTAASLSRLSSAVAHIRDTFTTVNWLLRRLLADRQIRLQTGNLVVYLIVDTIGGLAVAHALKQHTRPNKTLTFSLMAAKTEELLEFIKCMVKWLMGSPAGLKLNYPLNYILGNFFLYNIHLWWTFLGMIRPVLEIGFNALLKLGFLGVTLQIAILADIFSLVTFHLYCIYVYAARLYQFQVKGILSLSKIFLGRKRNPEPDKVDSCPYSTEQLFVGTVCFTVLLFLLPTTLVYYVVFTLFRLGFVFLGGLLRYTRFLLQILPIYSSIVWLVYPQLVVTTTKLVPVRVRKGPGAVSIIAEPQVSSWLETSKLCLPDILHKPMAVDWKRLLGNVLTGRLIYSL